MTYETTTPPPPPPQGNGLAVASMVLGILSVLTAWIPVIGFIAWILAPLGLILGFVAMGKARGKGMAITGIITSVIGLVICIAWVLGMGAMMNTPEMRDAMERARAQQQQQQQSTTTSTTTTSSSN